MWLCFHCSSGVKRRRSNAGVSLLFGCLLMTGACVPQKVTVTSSPGFQPSAIHKLAILPFQTLSTPQRYIGRSSQPLVEAPPEIRSQFSLPAAQLDRGRFTNADSVKVPKLAAEQITRMVYESLEHRADVALVSSLEVNNALLNTGANDPAVHWKEKIQYVESRLNVDAVLVGLVRTYREREGTKFGARPAAVGFEVHLVDSQSGKIQWTGEYYEEQKPLNEDLMGFVERGGTFVTAHELAEYGVQKMMKQFPVGRKS